MHNLLFFAHTKCIYQVAETILLASSSVRNKQLLCFLHGQGQKSEQKHTTKNFVDFHNHSPLLTMLRSDVQTPAVTVLLWISLFKLDELLVSLRRTKFKNFLSFASCNFEITNN